MALLDIFKKTKQRKEKKEKVEKVAKKEKKKEVKPEAAKVKKEKVKKEETGEAYRVLVKPLVTEKASFLGQYNQYVFEVTPGANKVEVARAIKNVYGIKPVSVNIIQVRGKEVRYGRTRGKTKERKKAVITLPPGEKIEVYEGV